MGAGEFNARGNLAMDWHPIQAGVEILLVASCYRNWRSAPSDGPLGSQANLSLNIHIARTLESQGGFTEALYISCMGWVGE